MIVYIFQPYLISVVVSKSQSRVRLHNEIGPVEVCVGERPSKLACWKKWKKDLSGVYIIDGFVYRGSRAFGKVVVGLKELMKKGYQSDINGIDVKVIDSRTNGNGHEIEVKGRDIEELQFLNCTDQAKRKIRML